MEKFDFKFYKWEKETPNKVFLKQPFGSKWESWTWAEVGDKARRIANALLALDLPPKSHIGLVSKNCREWIVADLAIMMAGYVSVPFFPTLTGKQLEVVLDLGDVKALFVGKVEDWDGMKTGISPNMPIISFPHYEGNSEIDRGQKWEDLLLKHERLEETAVISMDDLWTIVFTSGTTGTPKGVMLDYKILDNASIPIESTNPLKIDLNGNNRFFSYLPLNHIAERLVVEVCVFSYGGEIYFTESLENFAKNLQDAKPTIFLGVPRIYTKFQQAILAKMPQARLNTLLKIPIVSKIIKKKLRTALGLNAAKIWVSGAAPLPESLKLWYAKIGIYISNGYGMTENCAIFTLLEAGVNKSGSVGKPQIGAEIKIDEETGEILNSGKYVMRGYYKNPEKTAEVFQDGWLKTGDQGYVDDDGFLYITGRIKDTFKTSKGKYIVPGPIEWALGANQDIEQICLVGLGCPQPMALINVSALGLQKDAKELEQSLTETLNSVNSDLPNYQKVAKIIVLKEAWSVDNGCLTPTLKIKRNVINNNYQSSLDTWYQDEARIILTS